MSMDKPFRVEVSVDAPRDVVWRTLTEPEQIRHWFGWDYDKLDEEIHVIFVEHARLLPPDRIELFEDGVAQPVEVLVERRWAAAFGAFGLAVGVLIGLAGDAGPDPA